MRVIQWIAQGTGAVEYTDCFSADHLPTNTK